MQDASRVNQISRSKGGMLFTTYREHFNISVDQFMMCIIEQARGQWTQHDQTMMELVNRNVHCGRLCRP